jgi:hypothetical protein
MNYDRLWGERSFLMSQVQGWLVVVASFGSAIAAAGGAPGIYVAIAAAIPGTVILIDRNFGFTRRAQWHWLQESKLRELEHALKYQGAKVADVSKKYATLRTDMEKIFPLAAPDIARRPDRVPHAGDPP